MRGGVSLAAALALPLTLVGGGLFPERDLVIFLTFCVILATLVGQGLSLAPFDTFAPSAGGWVTRARACPGSSDSRTRRPGYVLTNWQWNSGSLKSI